MHESRFVQAATAKSDPILTSSQLTGGDCRVSETGAQGRFPAAQWSEQINVVAMHQKAKRV